MKTKVSREELKDRILMNFKKFLESKPDHEKSDVILKAIQELKKKI